MSSASYFFAAPNDEVAASAIDGEMPPFVFAKRIDPFEAIPRVEGLLTGRSCDTIQREFISKPPIAIDEGGEGFIAAMSEPLAAALASADRAQLADVAVSWAQIEEFEGRAQADGLADLLGELADLVRRADQQGHRIYCLFLAA